MKRLRWRHFTGILLRFFHRPLGGPGGTVYRVGVHFNSSFRSFPVIWSTTMTMAAISRMMVRAIS